MQQRQFLGNDIGVLYKSICSLYLQALLCGETLNTMTYMNVTIKQTHTHSVLCASGQRGYIINLTMMHLGKLL